MSLTQQAANQPGLQLTDAGLQASSSTTAIDEYGMAREGHIAAERALTIYLDKKEIVTQDPNEEGLRKTLNYGHIVCTP